MIRSRLFADYDDFLRRAPKQALGLMTETRKIMHQELAREVHALTPVGSAATKDRRPRRLKRSLKMTPGRPITIGDQASPHAQVIDRGRKRGFTPRGQKRVRGRKGRKRKVNKLAPMLGSKQAPQGITRPAWRTVQAKHDAIVAKAIAEAEKK